MATRQYEFVSLLKTPISLLFSKLVLTTAMMESKTLLDLQSYTVSSLLRSFIDKMLV